MQSAMQSTCRGHNSNCELPLRFIPLIGALGYDGGLRALQIVVGCGIIHEILFKWVMVIHFRVVTQVQPCGMPDFVHEDMRPSLLYGKKMAELLLLVVEKVDLPEHGCRRVDEDSADAVCIKSSCDERGGGGFIDLSPSSLRLSDRLTRLGGSVKPKNMGAKRKKIVQWIVPLFQGLYGDLVGNSLRVAVSIGPEFECVGGK